MFCQEDQRSRYKAECYCEKQRRESCFIIFFLRGTCQKSKEIFVVCPWLMVGGFQLIYIKYEIIKVVALIFK